MVNLNRNSLTAHILNEEDVRKMRMLIDKLEITINRREISYTDFYDPHEVILAESILNRFTEVNYNSFGGFENSERNIIAIFPSFIDSVEFPIKRLCIENSMGFEHRDVLGSILGLGIDRSKIGDIVFESQFCHVFLKSEISDYVEFNLEKISRYKANFIEREFIEPELEFISKEFIISSLRLDTFVSAVTKKSRAQTNSIITSGDVKLNYKVVSKPSEKLSESDMVSIRHFGRFYLREIKSVTKKGNLIVEVEIPK